MKPGTQIKKERLQQGMKLEVLAQGICSPSYISRIENGKCKPNEEILSLLSNRLNFSLTVDSGHTLSDISELEARCFQTIHLRDNGKAVKITAEIESILDNIADDCQLKTGVELLGFRMKLAVDNSENLLEQLSVYNEIAEGLTRLQAFRVAQMLGMVLYKTGNFKKCTESLEKAVDYQKGVVLTESEKADFAYIRAVTSLAIGNYLDALEHVNEALPYFQTIMAVERVVECHIVSGVAFKRTGKLEKALHYFEKAEQIAQSQNISSFLGILHQNMGGVYSALRKSEQAISHYKRALLFKEKPLELMYTLLALTEEFERMGDYRDAIPWLTKGKRLLPQLSIQKLEYYQTHFSALEAICTENEETIEESLVNAVRIFKKRGNRAEWKEYAQRLGAFYAKTKKYKKATTYYEMILEEERK